ncbi:alkaline phosphatase family protein [Marinobacter sp. KMM 10035]|uniref:alkaline phosphatase family protein n=1 Tax=Marinobacter sp. KMM 10035 TaxID=3134034 RepID=UPI003978A611
MPIRKRPKSKHLAVATAALVALSGCNDSDKKDASADVTSPETEAPVTEPTRKALVIGIDGLMYDYIDVVDNPELNEPETPNFARFTLTKSFAGGLLNTTSHQPSYSGPSWSSILTGTWVDGHGVQSNNSKPVDTNSIFTTLEQRDQALKSGSFVSWTPINSGHLIKEMSSIDRRIDGASRPEGKSVDTFITEQLVNELEQEDSTLDFIFTHLDEVDGAGHSCGWCEPYETALSETDARLGQIMAAVEHRERNLNEDWLVMVVSDHGHRQAGGHGGDTVIERTSVIGVNKPEMFNQFLTTPAAPLSLSDNVEQNTLMAYPAITSVMPTVMTYLGHNPAVDDQLASPSLIGELGTYKLLSSVDQAESTVATVNLSWQATSDVNKVFIYRDNKRIAEMSAEQSSYVDSLKLEDLGEGSHAVVYSVQADIGAPVSSRVKVSLAEPVDLGSLLTKRQSLSSFNETVAPFGWVSEASATPAYVDGPFTNTKAVNLQRSQGYLSQAKDLSNYDQISFGFRFRINGNIQGDPHLLSNKDWASGYNPGFIVTVTDDSIKLNLGDGSHRADTSWMPLAKNQWIFAVATIDITNSQAALYLQDATFGFQASQINTGSVSSLASPYPLNIGEGGDGHYNVGRGVELDIADLVTFDRSLTEAEAKALANTTAPLGDL